MIHERETEFRRQRFAQIAAARREAGAETSEPDAGQTMQPDLVFAHNGDDVYVGDVKYKMATGPARLRDYYQVLAYTTAMGLPEGVLIYAQDPSAEPADVPVHSIAVRNSGKVIHTYRLPLGGANVDVELALGSLAAWIASATDATVRPIAVS